MGMTDKDVREASELLDTLAAFTLSPEEFGEVVADQVWAVMRDAGKAYVKNRLRELNVELADKP